MTTQRAPHPFDHIGTGPFRFVGMVERVGPYKTTCPKSGADLEIGYAGQPMGTCAHCGTGIKYCCQIVDANGKRFEVGVVCVLKTEDRDLTYSANREKSKIDAKNRQRLADAKRAARAEVRKAERAKWEAENAVRMAQEAAKRAEQANTNAETFSDVLEALGAIVGVSGFAMDMHHLLKTGTAVTALSPRQRQICFEITAKTCGRAGSNAYSAKLDDLYERAKN